MSSQQVFFIGDLHLGHEGILQFGQRNFSSIGEHDAHLLQQWNSVVKKQKDIVWVMGDVAMNIEALKLLSSFNGDKRLILGNHDRFDLGVYQKYFSWVGAFQKRYHGMVMTHIPVHPCEMEYRNWKWNIHGHCHREEKGPNDPRYINVCADSVDLTPISLSQVRSIIDDRKE